MTIELEILKASYWEHFKYAKDLRLILPNTHPKLISLNKEMDKMLEQINKLN